MVSLFKLLDDSLESFYWMGFVMADGWVTINGPHKIFGVMLSEKDIGHLTKLGKYIEAPISTYTRSTNFKTNVTSCLLKVGNADIVPKLRDKFQIHNDKTSNPPCWSELPFNNEQKLAMIIGYIDGDGSIAKRVESKRLHLSIQSCIEWVPNLEFLKDFVGEYFNTPVKSKVLVNNRNHATLSICRNSFLIELKKFAINNNLPILERKWDVVDLNTLSGKNSMKSPTFKSACGMIVAATSVRQFALKYQLNYNSVLRLVLGEMTEYKGWKVLNE